MKHKKSLLVAMLFVAVSALTGCGKEKKITIDFWTGFGGGVAATLDPLLQRFEELNPDVKIRYETKGGYPNLNTAVKQSISNKKYPHIANGYPDHFADYANSNVLVNLDSPNFIKHPEHGLDVDRFYEDYMQENREIVDDRLVGLPFNKSTEIMVVNKTFFDVATELNPEIYVPKTWQELEDVGEKIIALVDSKGWIGKLVTHEGVGVEKPAKPTPEFIETIAFDMTAMTKISDFRPFNWDSTSNFFITILRQWGSVYTERGANFQTGRIRFHDANNFAKTKEALLFMQNLFRKGIVGIPQTYGSSSFGSGAFKEAKIVLTISSSAGIKENLPTSSVYPFDVEVAPILFNRDADGVAHKEVISQGTNLALFTRGDMREGKGGAEERQAAWRLLRYLTYEVNHEFGKGTSYFPVTDGSKLSEGDEGYTDYKLYTDFLAADGGTVGEIATRDTANLQSEVYTNEELDEPWIKFVDPAFIGSSQVRAEVEYAMGYLFDGDTPEKVMEKLLAKLGSYVDK